MEMSRIVAACTENFERYENLQTPEATPPASAPPTLTYRLRNRVWLTLQHISITITLGLCGLMVLNWFADLSPWIELSVHFALHALVLAVLVIPFLWASKHKRTAIVCSVCGLWFGYLVQPWIFIPVSNPAEVDSVKILSWNVLAMNERFDAIEEVIRQSNPELLILIEVRPDLMKNLPWVTENYTHASVMPAWSGSGIGVLLRNDVDKIKVEYSVEYHAFKSMPSIVARLTNKENRSMEVSAVHTYSPNPPERGLQRDSQLLAYLEWVVERPEPQCLVGDLNTTPWAKCFWELERAGFKDSRHGVGNQASWPTILGSFGIPIDHALTRGACSIHDRKILSVDAGSDHQPVEFQLAF